MYTYIEYYINILVLKKLERKNSFPKLYIYIYILYKNIYELPPLHALNKKHISLIFS